MVRRPHGSRAVDSRWALLYVVPPTALEPPATLPPLTLPPRSTSSLIAAAGGDVEEVERLLCPLSPSMRSDSGDSSASMASSKSSNRLGRTSGKPRMPTPSFSSSCSAIRSGLMSSQLPSTFQPMMRSVASYCARTLTSKRQANKPSYRNLPKRRMCRVGFMSRSLVAFQWSH